MNLNRMIQTGAITGPYRKTRPVRGWRFYLGLWSSDVRGWLQDTKEALRVARLEYRFQRNARRYGPDNTPF